MLSDASPPTGGTSGPAQFTLVRADGDSLPALDSGDSVALTTGVEYREIYLERGTLTLLQDPQARFETLLHYAQASPVSGPFWHRQGYRPLWTTWPARPAAALR